MGYMGAGKTTMGKKLASALSLDFIDIDIFIETRYKKTINQIFEELGEKKFREIENSVLKEISEFDNVIVSTGGGTPCFFDNIDVMNQTGLTIYLEATPSALAKRLHKSKEKRPLLKDKTDEELVDYIRINLEKRVDYYNQAHFIFNTDNILTKEDIDSYIEPLIKNIEQTINRD